MATDAICGQNGAVFAGTHEVAEIGSWDMTLSRSVVDVPKFGGSRNKIVCGPYEWTGTFSGSWYMGDTLGQVLLEDALKAGTSVTLKLQVASGKYYTGSAQINQEQIGVPHDGLATVSFSFVGTGDLTLTYA